MRERFLKKLGFSFKIFLAIFSLFLAVFFATVAYNFSFYGSKAQNKKDCILVFGAALGPGGEPSLSLKDRVSEAVKLYKAGLAPCVVLSGADSAYGKHEVRAMEEMALEKGVPESALLLDRNGRNTCKSIRNLDKSKSYILLSNDFHLARIKLLANRYGLQDYALHSSGYESGPYEKWNYFLAREVFALWFYLLRFDNDCLADLDYIDITIDSWLSSFLSFFK